MICDICKKNVATIHIQEICGTEKKVLHLCQECATKKAQEDSAFQSFNLAEVLYNISSQLSDAEKQVEKSEEDSAEHQELVCPECGWDYSAFRKTGRLGCPECYNVFYDILKSAIAAMHRGTVHLGKKPEKQGDANFVEQCDETARWKREINRCQSELNDCVRDERYEEAAVLRDRINELKSKLESAENGNQA